MKKLLAFFITSLTAFSLTAFSACDDKTDNSLPTNSSSVADLTSNSSSVTDLTSEKIQEFYDLVSLSKQALDIVAEDVYSYWYSSIYDGAYEYDINAAILAAQNNNSEIITQIELNDSAIQDLYREIRESKLSTEIRAVMSIYLDYYEFAINVSGSFQQYKEQIDPLQKNFDNALKALLLEM